MTRKQPFYIVVLFTLLEPTWREIFDLQTSVHHRQRRWRLQLRRENKHYITLTLHVCAFKNALKTIKYQDEYDQKIIQDLTLFEKNYGKTARVFGKSIRESHTVVDYDVCHFPAKRIFSRYKSKYKNVGVLPIRIAQSNVSSVGPSSKKNLFSLKKGQCSKRQTILSVLAVHQPFYISICISTLPTQHTTFSILSRLVHLRHFLLTQECRDRQGKGLNAPVL